MEGIMARRDIVMATQEELKRLHIIRKALDQLIRQKEAAEILDLSTRQVRRIAERIKEEGDPGVIHRSRGKTSNRALPFKNKVLKLFEKKYQDFGPTLASEKLFEIDQIKVSDETLRLWLLEKKIPYPERRKRHHRAWRERKPHLGEMIQMDGSHHDWFEERGPKCVLMAYIDDATGRPFARFYTHEGLIPAMDSFKRYIQKHGIPQSVYLDRHSTYKSTQKPKLQDELRNEKPLTQFARALQELGVHMIYAWSPQAKGRIERLFKTFQDRLIKEMRLRGIKTIDEANRFLGSYIPVYSRRFSVQAAGEGNLHRPLTSGMKLNDILSVKMERTLRNDFTVAHDGKLYQIKDPTGAKQVLVIERLSGALTITYKGKALKFKEIIQRPGKELKKPRQLKTIQKAYSPAVDHPWRSLILYPNRNHKPKLDPKPLLTAA